MNSSANPARRFALFVATLLCLTTAGCGSLIGPSNPPAQIYRLSPELASPTAGPTLRWQLAVARPSTSRTLDSDRIALLRGAVMDYYADAQWNDSVPRLLQSLLVEAFDRSGRIQAASTDSNLRADYTLTTEVRDFEAQYDAPNTAPTVVIDIETKLFDPRGQVIASMDSRQTARATQDSLAGVVAAFDQAMGAALARIVGWTLETTPH